MREPTAEMCFAGYDAASISEDDADLAAVWRAMLDAAFREE